MSVEGEPAEKKRRPTRGVLAPLAASIALTLAGCGGAAVVLGGESAHSQAKSHALKFGPAAVKGKGNESVMVQVDPQTTPLSGQEQPLAVTMGPIDCRRSEKVDFTVSVRSAHGDRTVLGELGVPCGYVDTDTFELPEGKPGRHANAIEVDVTTSNSDVAWEVSAANQLPLDANSHNP